MRRRQFLRKTKKGKIKKIVSEHYLRDDISCGSVLCNDCNNTNNKLDALKNNIIDKDCSLPVYLIVDTNVILHQLDVINHKDAFHNIIFLQNVLEEVKHRNMKLYSRTKQMIIENDHYIFSNEHHRSTYIERNANETPNDRNDRAIRVATQWYVQHLKDKARIILLTNDIDNKQKAIQQNLETYVLSEFVKKYLSNKFPQLVDALALSKSNVIDVSTQNNDLVFQPYLEEKIWHKQVSEGKLFKGTFRINRNFWSEGFVGIKYGKDFVRVCINGKSNMNRAFDGDIVVVEIVNKNLNESKSISNNETKVVSLEEKLDDQNKMFVDDVVDLGYSKRLSDNEKNKVENTKQEKLHGHIVAIVQRNWKSYCGSLEETDKESGSIMFIPVNRCIPRIRIESRQISQLMDKRIIVQVDSWPRTSKVPLGHYVRSLGTIGDRDTETTVLLIEHDVSDSPFSNNVMKCLPDENYKITDQDMKGRLDLRETKCIFSIDPPNCKDIDDALHIVQLENGNYEVGVHIADVTHYMKPNTPLDDEAQQRATSVYLVDRRIDMIPTRLSTDLCSLVANVDRLAFSVIWELSNDGEIVKVSFHKTIIRSCAALAYQQAQQYLDQDPKSNDSNIAICCRQLNMIAKCLRKKRLNAGALELASMEVKFLLDDQSQQPLDVEMYKLKEANQLVEEFMLLANISVARHILKHFPSYALLRRHPEPPNGAFDEVIRAAKLKGFDIDATSSKTLSDTLSKAQIPNFPFFNYLLRIMTTRCMMQAVYTSSGDVEPQMYKHYGLASDIYTHFTSPIRRYADVVVHRLLATSLGIDPIPPSLQDRDGVSSMCELINHRHRMAQLVSRASSELYTLIYFRDKKVIEDGIISSIRPNGIRIIIPKYGIENSIKFSNDDEDHNNNNQTDNSNNSELKYDEERMSLIFKDRQYCIFDQIKVIVYVKQSKMRRQWLAVELVDDEETLQIKRQKLE